MNKAKKRLQTNCLPFLVSAIFMFLLCIKGGTFGIIGEYPLKVSLPFLTPTFNIPAGKFIIIFALTWAASLILMLLYPRNLSFRSSCLLILLLATICRIALLPHPPSDDINRYLWEGKVLSNGYSPYIHAPNSKELAGLAKDDPFQPQVNHPEITAAYPPFALYVFAVIGKVSYSPVAMKTVMIIFDMGTIGLILLLLRNRSLDPRWSILYAFNPVVLYSFAGQGHFDSIQTFFLFAALLLYDSKRWGFMFLMAGLAVQSKYTAIIAVPFLFRRDNLKYIPILGLTIIIPYLPFLRTDGGGVLSSLLAFGGKYAYNGSIHAVFRTLFGGIEQASAMCIVLLGLSLLAGYWYFHPERNKLFKNEPSSGCFFAFGALLILSPTVHFWYLTWIIPFIALRPTTSWTFLTLTIGASFITNGIFHYTGNWTFPWQAQTIVWMPFLMLLLRDAYLTWHRAHTADFKNPPQSVSVVIPTMNEAMNITECVKSASSDAVVMEVIVVDANSKDLTVALAEEAGARVIHHDTSDSSIAGRGGQIYAGIVSANADVVAIVHADTLIQPDTFNRIIKTLTAQPMVIGGAVGGVFDAEGWRLRLLEFANEWRMVCLGISFGDQVQFFRRIPIIEKHAYPAIPLMEDVEFSLRLHKMGRQTFLFGNALVSARRWQTKGYSRSILVIQLVAEYLWRRIWGKVDTQQMYEKYYK